MASQNTYTKPNSNSARPALTVLENESEIERFAKNLRQIIDRAAILIVRELSMNVRRFQDIQVQTKIGSPLLTSRLRRLERDGLIERRQYNENPPRYEYFATAKGRDLDEFLLAAGNWNVIWGDLAEPSLVVFDNRTGQRLTAFPNRNRQKIQRVLHK